MHTSYRETRDLSVSSLLVVLLVTTLLAVTASGGLGPLPLDSSSSSTTEGRVQGVVNVSGPSARDAFATVWNRYILLGVKSDNERRDVDNLLADSDVPLPDEDTGVVDGLGESGCRQLKFLETSPT